MRISRNSVLAAGLLGAAAVVAGLLVALMATGQSPSAGPLASRLPQPSPTPIPLATLSPGATPAASAADRARRVADILESMDLHGFNPAAPPPKTSTLSGGVFINWRGSWDGDLSTASENTNIQTSGLSDEQAGADPRHDPVTDLLYLRALLAYAAAHPADHSFDGDRGRIEPIVRAEFSGYTFYRGWLYFEFRDLDRLEPGRGWDAIAHAFASAVYSHFYDQGAGTIIDKSHGTYRTDWSVEAGAMLLDAGRRYGQPSWSSAGRSTIDHVLANARDPHTHLFPLVMTARSGGDTVQQGQLKLGSEAQLLDALLTAYEITGDGAELHAVQDAVNELYAPALGLWDSKHGGFFFSVQADGSLLQSGYKESRQAWMLPLLEHLDRLDRGHWTSRADEMLAVVRDSLWQPAVHGYVYRLRPDFTLYQNHNGGITVTEDFVTTEAMGIAAQALQGP